MGMVGVEEGELSCKNSRQQVPKVVDEDRILVEVAPARPKRRTQPLGGLPGEGEGVQQEIRCDTGEELHSSGAEDARTVIVLEQVGHLGAVLHCPQPRHQGVAVLHGLATALPEVGHHGVASIAHQCHGAVRPGLEEGGRPVIEGAILDCCCGGRADEVRNLPRPAEEGLYDVGLLQLGLGGERGTLRNAAEGIPLNTAPANVGADEVLLGPHVDLVAHVEIVLWLVDRLAGKDDVAAVGAARSRAFLLLVPHLRPRGRPDPVTTQQHVSLHLRAVIAGDADPCILGQNRVASHLLPILQRPLRELGEEELLQVGTIHNASVGQAFGLCRRLHRIEGTEPLRPERINKAVPPVAGECELLHEAFEDRLVDITDYGEGIRSQLDGAAKSRKGVCLLQDLHIERRNF
mmetsp:Transcript_21085/g.44989  ORF Transcript_21085/g.44989 Transcript_21085/m.44989 type:complete len:405 (+) Transcript_21085:363-1577(+)